MIIILMVFGIVTATFLIRHIVISRKQKKSALLSIISLTILFIILAPAFLIPYARYGYYSLKCGHAPILAQGFGRNYFVPGTKAYNVSFFISSFYCSEAEAKANSYQRYEVNP